MRGAIEWQRASFSHFPNEILRRQRNAIELMDLPEAYMSMIELRVLGLPSSRNGRRGPHFTAPLLRLSEAEEAAGCGEKCQCHEPPEATEEKPKHLTPRARID